MANRVLAIAEELSQPLFEFTDLVNPNYTLVVYLYMLSQYRIQLTDKRQPDRDAPEGHGAIVQDLCTDNHTNLVAAITALRLADDPASKKHEAGRARGTVRTRVDAFAWMMSHVARFAAARKAIARNALKREVSRVPGRMRNAHFAHDAQRSCCK